MGSMCLRCLVSLALLSLLGLGAMGTDSPTFHFINNMPNSQPIHLYCKIYETVENFGHLLQLGEDYQWKPKPNKGFFCTAAWELYFAQWDGYMPERDHGHPDVYHTINRTGFYLHYDKVHFKLVEEWETE